MIQVNEAPARARQLYQRVFASTDPWRTPFVEGVTARQLWFPLTFLLDEVEMAAVRAAASSIDEATAYIGNTEGAEVAHLGDFWEIPLSVEAYDILPSKGFVPIKENALVSPSGRWGLLISSDDFGVIGGVPEFMVALRRAAGSLDQGVTRFIEDRRAPDGSLPADVLTLLEHVYGGEVAAGLVSRGRR